MKVISALVCQLEPANGVILQYKLLFVATDMEFKSSSQQFYASVNMIYDAHQPLTLSGS